MSANISASELQVGIETLAKADIVFTGTCMKAEAKIDYDKNPKGTPVTAYTFKVTPADVIKGNVPENFEFKQWGMSKEDAKKFGVLSVVDNPVYEVGKEYTLFLTDETELGLRAPVALGQGSFTVVQSPDGTKKAVNSLGNKGLFKNSASSSVAKALKAASVEPGNAMQGPIDLEALKSIVQSLGAEDPQAVKAGKKGK